MLHDSLAAHARQLLTTDTVYVALHGRVKARQLRGSSPRTKSSKAQEIRIERLSYLLQDGPRGEASTPIELAARRHDRT